MLAQSDNQSLVSRISHESMHGKNSSENSYIYMFSLQLKISSQQKRSKMEILQYHAKNPHTIPLQLRNLCSKIK